MSETERLSLTGQGHTLHLLMLHRASYNAFPSNDERTEDAPATNESAPDQPSVYTDGSVRPPRPPWMTSAAIGA